MTTVIVMMSGGNEDSMCLVGQLSSSERRDLM